MTTAPDMLSEFGGVPVGSRQTFEGWWGATTFFVDYDNGGVGAYGDSMDAPAKNLRSVLSDCSAGDTIYIKPRDFSTEDAQWITPDTAANWTIATAKHEVSIIGTGKGVGHGGVNKCFIAGYSGQTTAVITIYAPGCVIENLRSQPRGSVVSGIFYSVNDATYDGGDTTFINNDFHGANTTGAIRLDSTWHMSIVGNRFVNCDVGIWVTSTYSAPQMFQMWNNTFAAATTEVQNDFYSLGAVKRFVSYNNYHTSGVPALGGTNMYYKFGAPSTGGIHNCFFGLDDVTEANVFTLNGVLQSGNYSMNGLIT